MSTLRSQITDSIKEAMRAHDAVSLDALRYALSLIKNVEIDLKHELSDPEVIGILQKEVKNRREAIDQFQAGGRDELVEQEQQKLNILVKFLPKQLSNEEVETKVKQIIETLPSKEMPIVMKEVMAQLKGKADGKIIADAVKSALS